jgi:hypothetical protein
MATRMKLKDERKDEENRDEGSEVKNELLQYPK